MGRDRAGSRRKRRNVGENEAYLVENVPRIRRPGSTGDRVGSPGNLEKSGRSPDSAAAHIRRVWARLYGGASGTQERRRKRGAIWANGPRIWWVGSEVNHIGSAGNFEICQRPADSVAGHILGLRARLHRGASGKYESRRKRAAIEANGLIIRRPGSRVSRAGSSGDLEIYGRSPDSVSEHIRGVWAKIYRAPQ